MDNIEIIKTVEVLRAANIVHEYLFNSDCTSTEYYDSDKTVIMHTDVDYFNGGLTQLIGYLSAKVDELREEKKEVENE